ncbi:hypothetical protein [Catenuloplanes japonicus]|uniref:hypothetical protein n=1 Tax=Catenuloplanes japonicus TaxID=33876 RepID=UPI000526911B|nr:hypothetical protein [Catenuloplanes japonicus]
MGTGHDAVPLNARLQRAMMRTVFRLPDAIKRRVTGPPIVRDGQTLALDAQLLTTLSARAGVRLVVDDSPEKSRRRSGTR